MAAFNPPVPSILADGLHPPPVPSHPPSGDGMAESPFFEQDVLTAELRPLQRDGQLQPSTIEAALQPIREMLTNIIAIADHHTALLARIEETVTVMDRRTALLFNQSRTDERFEVVRFPDLTHPRDRGLPLLTSRAAIEGLSYKQELAYYREYYPDGDEVNDDHARRLYQAIGVGRPL